MKKKEKELDKQLRKLKAIEEERELFEEWVNAPPLPLADKRYIKLKGGLTLGNKMKTFKCWKEASRDIITEFEQEGDKILTAWDNNGTILFITKPELPYQRKYFIGEKGLSQMDTPRLLGKAEDEKQALEFAEKYMENHDE